MNQIIAWVLELLYPSKCVLCTRLLEKEERHLCRKCREETEKVRGNLHRGSFFDHCCSVYYYEKGVASAIKRFKFGAMEQYARCFGELMAQRLTEAGESFDAITWVPVSAKRKRKRGYDQAEALARVIGRTLSIPVYGTLQKVRHNPPQSREKSAAGRRANVLNAYAPVAAAQISGLRLLVVDDVITSGATLNECCRILKMAGAASLICGTFAAAREL